jgi:hypothetical protein
MPKTFLLRAMRTVVILLSASLCLIALAQAQHGGGGGGHFGGGHFGGGHFGHGGHSSHAHSTGVHAGVHHWGWLHFGSRKSAGRDRVPAYIANGFRSAEMIGSRRSHSLPTTYIRTLPLRSLLSSPNERFSTDHPFRHRPGFFDRGFRRFPGSGCVFNGYQVCFFEPAWSLLYFSAGFDWFPLDWGFGGDDGYTDNNGYASDATDSTDMMTAPPMDSEAEQSANATNYSMVSPQPLRGLDLDPRFFLLILKNGAERVVTDYWLSDSYIEYVSRDGSRSHVPVDALDLGETVRNNSARGLRFVLRSAP